MKTIVKLLQVALLLLLPTAMQAQRKFQHPGISYTQADIDRMRAMIEAKQEPFYSGFLAMRDDDIYTRYHDIDREFPKDKNGKVCLFGDTQRQLWLELFGRIARNNALIWRLTDDTYYADRAVKVLNRYIGITSTWSYGTNCLDNAAATNVIEAAELMRDYSGWKKEDQDGFKAFLVHPGYSTIENYYNKYATHEAETNNVTIYWNILNGDPVRHGNQGLWGMRCLMAMGIYLDNDTIYDRALNKVLSRPHRVDDLPYPGSNITSYEPSYQDEYFKTWTVTGQNNDIDYGADDELKYWIYENGQCQEASRDQGHIQDGMMNFMEMARVAWNQGDDIYTQYDDRLLKGLIYTIKYNYGWLNKYIHNEAYWQGEDVFEPTPENGQFLQRRSRNKRWQSLRICPYRENGDKTWSRGKRFCSPAGNYSHIQPYIDYKVRVGRSEDSLLWVRRAYEMDQDSIMSTATQRTHYMMTDYRTPWMAGDGGTFDGGGLHVSGLPKMPGTLKAVDYDFYNNILSGEGLTYHYAGATRTDELYRCEGGMPIVSVNNGFAIAPFIEGSWMNYTVVFPTTGYYTLKAVPGIAYAIDGSAIVAQGEPMRVEAGARVIRVYATADVEQLTELIVEKAEKPQAIVDYRWNSRDYQLVSGSGTFLNDASDQSLYSTSYASRMQPSFTISATDMNYRVHTKDLYLLMKGENLSNASIRQATYRLTDNADDITKTPNSPQMNHIAHSLDDRTTLLVWKLDSTTNKRIAPVMKECYESDADSYTLRGLSFIINGKTLYLSTTISEISFYDLQSLYAAYPALNPDTPIVDGIVPISFLSPRNDGKIFSLDGRQISSLQEMKKGIYIQNGKKIIVSK